jgi:hypothetical protein
MNVPVFVVDPDLEIREEIKENKGYSLKDLWLGLLLAGVIVGGFYLLFFLT